MKRDSILFAYRSWKEQIKSIDFWIVQLCIFVFFSINCMESGKLLYENGGTIGIFASLPVLMTNEDFMLIIMAGFLMIICDIPVMRENRIFSVVRSDRLSWFVSQFLYSVLMSATYLVSIFFYSIVFYIRNISFNLQWGESVEDGSAFLAGSIVYDDSLLTRSPLFMIMGVLIILTLLCVFFAMLCCVSNMMTESGIGVGLCAVFIIAERLTKTFEVNLGFLSPVGMLKNFYSTDGTNFFPIISYFVFLVVLLMILGMKTLQKTNIN